MSKPKVYIRADGNAQIGLGHIHRTIALAGYLVNDFEVAFCVLNPEDIVENLIHERGYNILPLRKEDYSNPEIFTDNLSADVIVVLDGYNFKTDYQKKIRENGNKLVVIDDLNEWEQVADVVINHAYSGVVSNYKISENTTLYAGLDYVLLKADFANVVNAHTARIEHNNILVCIGGTDPLNYSEKIVKEITANTNKKIALITYPLNSNFNQLKLLAEQFKERIVFHHSLNTNQIIELIQQNDIAILQPSNIALEAASLGIYIALIQTAENQKFVLETLVNKNCGAKIELEKLAEVINSISLADINLQINKQRNIFDNNASKRVLSIFKSLVC